MAGHSGLLNEVGAQVGEMRAAVMGEMRASQKTPIGTEARSGQQEAAFWARLMDLPKPEFDTLLNFAAARVGHQNNEPKPCKLCEFVIRGAARDQRTGKVQDASA